MQETRSGQDDLGGPMVVRQDILPVPAGDVAGVPADPNQQPISGGSRDRSPSPRHQATQASRLLGYWEIRRESFSVSQSAQRLVEASWRGSTEKRYGGAWRQWLSWCNKRTIPATSPSLSDVLDYLASLFDKGAQYRTINLHRSALSATLRPIEGFCVGQHPLVCRLLKGVFNSRPPRPKLSPTWSVQDVLETISSWSPASRLDFKQLSLKTCMLVAWHLPRGPVASTFCQSGRASVR